MRPEQASRGQRVVGLSLRDRSSMATKQPCSHRKPQLRLTYAAHGPRKLRRDPDPYSPEASDSRRLSAMPLLQVLTVSRGLGRSPPERGPERQPNVESTACLQSVPSRVLSRPGRHLAPAVRLPRARVKPRVRADVYLGSGVGRERAQGAIDHGSKLRRVDRAGAERVAQGADLDAGPPHQGWAQDDLPRRRLARGDFASGRTGPAGRAGSRADGELATAAPGESSRGRPRVEGAGTTAVAG